MTGSSIGRKGWRTGDERGQAFMAVVIGVTTMIVAFSAVLVLQAIHQAPLTHSENVLRSATAAAESGVADYRAHVMADPTYPVDYCSKAAFPATGTCHSRSRDISNPAFLTAEPTGACVTSAVTTTDWTNIAPAGDPISEGYQYLADTNLVTSSSTGGTIYLYVTGRAGVSGRYTCVSKAVALQVQGVSRITTVSVPTSSTWVPLPAPPAKPSAAVFTLIGGGGAAGGQGGLSLGAAGGAAGDGAKLTLTLSGITQKDVFGAIDGGEGQIGKGGTGYGGGGAGGADGGGGGAGSALCLESTSGGSAVCSTSTPLCAGAALSTPCILAIAGGGGGGGETVCLGSSGGGGGSGGTLTGRSGGAGHTFTTILTGGDTTGPAGGGTQSAAGAGGTGYAIAFGPFPSQDGNAGTGHDGGAGVTETIGGDSGGGGGGYFGGGSGGTGLACGGGGGGGGGSSFVDTGFGSATFAVSPDSEPAPGSVSTQYTSTSTRLLCSTAGRAGCATGQSAVTLIPTGTTCGKPHTVAVPPGVRTISVTLQGAGGGGAGSAGGAGPGGNGGTGAALTVRTLSVAAGERLTYELGCGGAHATQGAAAPGGAGYTSGGAGEDGNYEGGLFGSGSYAGAGGGGGSTALCIGATCTETTVEATTSTALVAVAGVGGGGGEPNCAGASPGAGAGGEGYTAATPASAGGGSVYDGASGGTASGGGAGGGGGTTGPGGGGTGGAYGKIGSPGTTTTTQSGTGGAGAGASTAAIGNTGAGGGGGGYRGGGGGGSASCTTSPGGGSGGGGGGSSYVRTLAGVTATLGVAADFGQGNPTSTCTHHTVDLVVTVSSCTTGATSGGGGAIRFALKVPQIERETGPCSTKASAVTVASQGSAGTAWRMEIGGGGGATGLDGWPGGSGALLSATVTVPSSEHLAVVTACAGFYGSGGAGFVSGGYSEVLTGAPSTSGSGGGGGGASAICLERTKGATTCTSSMPACTTSSATPCVVMVAGGGGGGGADDAPTATTSCTSTSTSTSPVGGVGGDGGNVLSGKVTAAEPGDGYWAPGGADSGGLSGGGKGNVTGAPSATPGGRGKFSLTVTVSGTVTRYYEAGGGGGGWEGGAGGTTRAKCGGSGGSSWVAASAPGGVTLGAPTLGANTCASLAPVTAGATAANECSGTVDISTKALGGLTMVAEKTIPMITSASNLSTWQTA